jgi:hypothetical protein
MPPQAEYRENVRESPQESESVDQGSLAREVPNVRPQLVEPSDRATAVVASIEVTVSNKFFVGDEVDVGSAADDLSGRQHLESKM